MIYRASHVEKKIFVSLFEILLVDAILESISGEFRSDDKNMVGFVTVALMSSLIGTATGKAAAQQEVRAPRIAASPPMAISSALRMSSLDCHEGRALSEYLVL